MTRDWKKEAFEAWAMQWAAEEAAWRKNNLGKIRIYLDNSEDEPVFSTRGQVGLHEVVNALRAQKIEIDAPFMTLDAADAVGGYTGEIAVLATAFGPLLTGILGAWLQSKSSRKVRLKDGDIEVEARTVEEVRELLDMVEKHRQKRQEEEEP